MIDIYQYIATCDKLILPSAITRFLTHMHVPIPSTPLFSIMGAISRESKQRSAAPLMAKAKQPRVESTPAQQKEVDIQSAKDVAYASQPSSSSASSSSFGVEASFVTILDQFQ